jgi:hypothetical protein
VKIRQRATAGLGLVATLMFAVAGCTGTADSPTVNATGSASPSATSAPPSQATGEAAAALTQAAAELAKSSFKSSTTWAPGSSVVGLMDPPNKIGQTTLSTTIQSSAVTIDSLMFGTDVYLKIKGLEPTFGDKWLHVDVQRLSPDSQLGFAPGEFDPVTSERLLRTATDVHRTGDNAFAGTLDLSKATGVLGDKTVVNVNGDVTKVPFEATTDGSGRLATMKVNLPSTDGKPTRSIVTTYSDFGTPVNIQKPAAAEVVEAPDLLYKTLGR